MEQVLLGSNKDQGQIAVQFQLNHGTGQSHQKTRKELFQQILSYSYCIPGRSELEVFVPRQGKNPAHAKFLTLAYICLIKSEWTALFVHQQPPSKSAKIQEQWWQDPAGNIMVAGSSAHQHIHLQSNKIDCVIPSTKGGIIFLQQLFYSFSMK